MKKLVKCGNIFCDKTFPRSKNAKSGLVRDLVCSDCLEGWGTPGFRFSLSQVPYLEPGDTATAGYSGYNHGLDKEVKNKGEWKAAAQEQGLRPVDGW